MTRKIKTYYVCTHCGAQFQKWLGRCPECLTWNSIIEESISHSHIANHSPIDASLYPLSEVSSFALSRFSSGISEFDLVCGGGLVPGSVLLLGGEPGIGKSTLALQIAQHSHTLYFTGEETIDQIHLRAHRLGINKNSIYISPNTTIDSIETLILTHKPQLVIVDSIQTLYSHSISSPAGSVSQIRYTASRCAEIAKQTNCCIILIGHITKEGSIAGPKLLEHIVDTVLYFEGDFTRDYRILRAFKNRFGSINEIAIFTMSPQGLIELKDKNKLFLRSHDTKSPGTAISATIEGSRTILFEVQALVTATSFTNPRRMADGFDVNRLHLLIAVIEKHAHITLSPYDIFINVAGGFAIDDPSCDLAVASAILSSLKNIPIPLTTAILGELSLSGDVRLTTHVTRQLAEFSNSGITTIVVPSSAVHSITETVFNGVVIPIRNISELLHILQNI